ncbi:FecR family protein [Caenispirillum salinarum]|uniref:FecR family protein n=1 Tax=Caenispirillum salinarum TaxID=859058 RepID=UPI003850DF85
MSRRSRQTLREASAWFARLGRDDLSAGERAAFEAWRARPGNAAAFAQVQALWQDDALGAALAEDPAPRPAATPRFRVSRFMAVAAAAFLVVAMSLWGGVFVTDLRADHATRAGEHQHVVLADGSEVVLGAESAIRVAVEGPMREVHLLRGEAFFSVVPDSARPFRVLTGDVAVRVTGTAFGVRKEDAGASIRVREGAVEVSSAAGDAVAPRVSLSGRQGARVSGSEVSPLSERAVDAGLAWLDGRLVFRERPLSHVIAELDRYHAGLIVIARPELAERRVTGFFSVADPAAAVRAAADVVGAEVRGVGDTVLVLF